jgi:hypothetical protein
VNIVENLVNDVVKNSVIVFVIEANAIPNIATREKYNIRIVNKTKKYLVL